MDKKKMDGDSMTEGEDMAVLAKNVNVAFEIKESKTEDFFKKTNKHAYEQAIARADLHKKNKGN